MALIAFWVLSSIFWGAYFPSAWYPAAIVVVVLCPLLLAAGWRLPRGTASIALALLAAFVAWCAASILWAGAGGHALEATNKLLLALASAFIFAITPWTERRVLWALALLCAGIAAACWITLLSAALGDPAGSFIEGRYSEPFGYAGASAAFAGIAVWPSMALASRRNSSLWLRVAMFAIAVSQVEFALLPQSRGVLIALVVTAPLFVALSPARGWALVRIAIGIAIVVLTVGPVLHVYTVANDGGSIGTAINSALGALAVAVAISLAAGLAAVLLEDRRPNLVGEATARRARLPVTIAGLTVLVVAVAAFGGTASSEISKHWDAFKEGKVEHSEDTSHLATFSDPERYDYWRVALDVAEESPLKGVGAGNFQDVYTVKREDEKHSRYAHNIWLRVLSETGIIGLLLLLGMFAAALTGIVTSLRRLTPGSRMLIAGAVSASLLIFVHASVDWIEEFPPILGIGLCLLFLSSRLAAPPYSGQSRRQAATLLGGLVVAGIALISLVPAYLSLRFTERAEAEWPHDAQAAYKDLDRAAYLNPLSSQPDLTLGEIAAARNEDARAVHAYEQAIEKEDNWYPHFELSILASQHGERRRALAQMSTALRLDRLDELVRENYAKLRRGTNLNPSTVGKQIRAEDAERFYHLRPHRETGG
jgi:tetratricopeptide (TPR) repeat protein